MKSYLVLTLLLLLGSPFLSPQTCPLNRCYATSAATRYSCGMHPMVIADEPGLCPICGMELTPLQAADAGVGSNGQRVIKVDPVTVQRMALRTAAVEARTLARRIHTVGLVDFAEPDQYVINSKVSGWIEKLHVNESGQQVSAGAPLLEIYSPALVAAQEELLLALDSYQRLQDSAFPEVREDAERLLNAARQRLRLWDIPDRLIARLEKTGRVKKTLPLVAPAAGIVSRKQVREGEFVTAGRELLEISAIDKLWVYADIYEYEISWVKPGLAALIQFPFAEQPVTGLISTVYPYLDAKTRTIKARIDLPNPGLILKPDMYADVTILCAPLDAALSIPAEAVLYTGKRETVFVALGEGRFEPRRVRLGQYDEDGFVEILAGLNLGEQVVTSAQFMLDSESKLQEALQKMLEPESVPKQETLEELF